MKASDGPFSVLVYIDTIDWQYLTTSICIWPRVLLSVTISVSYHVLNKIQSCPIIFRYLWRNSQSHKHERFMVYKVVHQFPSQNQSLASEALMLQLRSMQGWKPQTQATWCLTKWKFLDYRYALMSSLSVISYWATSHARSAKMQPVAKDVVWTYRTKSYVYLQCT